MSRAAVLGSPIGHSLSPVLHRAAYAALGLGDWEYTAIECDEAALPGRLAGFGPEWRGLSLTMPLKRAAIPLVASVTPLAEAVGALNTVLWAEGGPRGAGTGQGDNTDVEGLVRALAEAGVTAPRSAVVLGAGGTAGAALAALRELGCPKPLLQVRSAARAAEAMEAAVRLGVRPQVGSLDDVPAALTADVIVCALPAAGGEAWADRLRAHLDAAGEAPRPGGVLLDVAYHPWPTPAAAAWTAAGGHALGGFPMLLHQAAAQVRLMTGEDPPVGAMRAAGEAELASRSS